MRSAPSPVEKGAKMNVKTDPVLEAIAKKLSGFGGVPEAEQRSMIHRAAKAARDAVRRETVEECKRAVAQALIDGKAALLALCALADAPRETESDEENEMLIIAFVQGAKWWEFHSTGGTMWQSDQSSANAEATRKANAGTLGVDPIRALADAPSETDSDEDHIHVELDFVPLTESLPEEDDELEELLPVLLNGNRVSQAWHSWSSATEEHFWELGRDATPDDVVTHWGEIQTIIRVSVAPRESKSDGGG